MSDDELLKRLKRNADDELDILRDRVWCDHDLLVEKYGGKQPELTDTASHQAAARILELKALLKECETMMANAVKYHQPIVYRPMEELLTKLRAQERG